MERQVCNAGHRLTTMIESEKFSAFQELTVDRERPTLMS